MGKTVIVAALDATFQRKPFNDVLSLVPIAEDVTKLSAVCNACGCDASFTKRVGSSDETVELIGGEGMYVATCRGCHDLPASSFSQRGTNTQNALAAAASTPKAAFNASRTPQRPPSSASSAERIRKRTVAEGTPVAGLVKTKGDVDTERSRRRPAPAERR